MKTLTASIAPIPTKPWALPCSLAIFVALLLRIFGTASHGGLYPEDDAYYYTVIAHNIARFGMSTFDGQSLTNGYHPLWLLVMVAQDKLVGASVLITFVIEAVLFSAALYLFLREAPFRSGAVSAIFSLIFFVILTSIILSGMEVALLIFCVGLLAWALRYAQRESAISAIVLGLAAGLCIGARIDSAFFVAPILLLAPANWRTKFIAFVVLGVCGAIYGAYNLTMFGAALPISSTIKSLGGLQINHVVLHQIWQYLAAFRLQSGYLWTLAGIVVSPLIWWLAPQGSTARAFAAGSAIGGAIYLIKIVLLSSWRVWPWYDFPLVFSLVCGLYVVLNRLEETGFGAKPALSGRAWTASTELALIALIGLDLGAAVLYPKQKIRAEDFESINRLALQRYSGILAGAPVAMGDRAGSFAAYYAGPVVQLEGLVNDKTYFQAVKRGDDITKLLCRRGVKFLADYQGDLGDYKSYRIQFLRPRLTQYVGPTLTVYRQDEVGRVTDLKLYDNRKMGDIGNNTLYLWRLGACDRGS